MEEAERAERVDETFAKQGARALATLARSSAGTGVPEAEDRISV